MTAGTQRFTVVGIAEYWSGTNVIQYPQQPGGSGYLGSFSLDWRFCKE